MSDTPLLRQLVDADLGTPVPPGAPITPERLFARRRRLLRRRFAVVACLLTACVPLIWWGSTSAAARRDAAPPRAAATAAPLDLAVLNARLDHLLEDARRQLAPSPAPRRDAQRRLRLELAMARAAALPDRPASSPPDRTR